MKGENGVSWFCDHHSHLREQSVLSICIFFINYIYMGCGKKYKPVDYFMQLCWIKKCSGDRNFVCVQEVLKLEKEIGYEFALRRDFRREVD